jgi:hypothetical protein
MSVAAAVTVGARVGVAVAVGIAAWVCVMASQAFAIAVFCTSTALTVGVASLPQADRTRIVTMQKIYKNFLFIMFVAFSIFYVSKIVTGNLRVFFNEGSDTLYVIQT